jgi:hypothetical protein
MAQDSSDSRHFSLSLDSLRALAGWAASCAERALGVYEARRGSHPGEALDPRPREAIEGARAFAAGGPRTALLRTLALAAYAAARETGDADASGAAAATATAACLAASSAYTHPLADVAQTKHIVGPAAYAILALELANPGDAGLAERELRLAIESAPLEVREILGRMPARSPGSKKHVDQLMYKLDSALRCAARGSPPDYSRLLENADPALAYQVARDLAESDKAALRALRSRIALEGMGRALLDRRRADGHWGNGVYNPKWTCTHYALFELVQLGIDHDNAECRASASLLLDFPAGRDGGVNYARTIEYSDVCVNGMILAIASYFGIGDDRTRRVADFLLGVELEDGGWNCEYFRGARKSSLHTTISVLEGISRFLGAGSPHRRSELEAARAAGIEFILRHELYKTSTTGEVIKDEFLKFCFPARWKYDILRCLDYFQAEKVEYDPRMRDALAIVLTSLRRKGFVGASSQPGKVYPEVKALCDGRKWNTLRALRVEKRYGTRL